MKFKLITILLFSFLLSEEGVSGSYDSSISSFETIEDYNIDPDAQPMPTVNPKNREMTINSALFRNPR